MEKLNQNQRIMLSLYIVWTFIHLIFLTIAEKVFSPDANYFWPFKMGDGWGFFEGLPFFYDFTEFLVYVGSPITFYTIYTLIKKKTKLA